MRTGGRDSIKICLVAVFPPLGELKSPDSVSDFVRPLSASTML